ncbi:hypothetical protein [Corynebacterium kalidii]
MTGRYTGSVRRRRDGGGGPDTRRAPVLVALEDPGLVDAVAMTVAATGRRLVRADELSAVDGLVVVTDAVEPEVPDVPGLVRVVRVTGEPGAVAAADVVGSGDAVPIQIPEGTQELAAAVGSHDPLEIAVSGVVGGAGTSVFAAALAGAVAEPGPDGTDGPGQALLVDADPLSPAGHLRVLLGAEGQEERDVTWVGDVGLVEAAGAAGERHTASPACPVVRDCGRGAVTDLPETVTARVLVVPQTVPAVLAARHLVAADGGVHVVLRELPRSGLTWNQTVSLLGRTPTVTWEDDPLLTVDVDRGDFRTTGRSAGTAATAAVRLLEQIR